MAFDAYLEKFNKALFNEDGQKLAACLSYKDKHCKSSKAIVDIRNLSRYISQHVESPWDAILFLHCQVLMNLDDWMLMAESQNALVQNFNAMFGTLSRWSIPVMLILNSELQESSSKADDILISRKEQPVNLEKAARTMNKAFSVCATDRYSELSVSRKWGVYGIVNQLFKTYFKLSSTNLCSTILRSMGSADLPDLQLYSKSQQVTFKFYTGVLSFFNERFEEAAEDFCFALKYGNVPGDSATFSNQRYLIPTQIIRGYLPNPRIFEKHPELQVYANLANSIREGNLFKFDEVFNDSQTILIKWGSWLIMERTRLLVVRQLFRKVWKILKQPSRISIEILGCGVAVSTRTKSSPEHVCCLVVNLIDQGYLKGYISHEKQVVVLSASNAFPNT